MHSKAVIVGKNPHHGMCGQCRRRANLYEYWLMGNVNKYKACWNCLMNIDKIYTLKWINNEKKVAPS